MLGKKSHVPNVSKHLGLFFISPKYKPEVSQYEIPNKPGSHEMIIQEYSKVAKFLN